MSGNPLSSPSVWTPPRNPPVLTSVSDPWAIETTTLTDSPALTGTWFITTDRKSEARPPNERRSCLLPPTSTTTAPSECGAHHRALCSTSQRIGTPSGSSNGHGHPRITTFQRGIVGTDSWQDPYGQRIREPILARIRSFQPDRLVLPLCI